MTYLLIAETYAFVILSEAKLAADKGSARPARPWSP